MKLVLTDCTVNQTHNSHKKYTKKDKKTIQINWSHFGINTQKPKPKPKLTRLIGPIRTAHTSELMTMHKCDTQDSAERF